jgi:hypothetical protein
MWWTSVDCERPDVMSAALCAQWSGVLSLYPSSLQPEAYAEARLPRNVVARLRALSDTKIVRSDDARSTTRVLLLLPLFTGVRGRGILGSSAVVSSSRKPAPAVVVLGGSSVASQAPYLLYDGLRGRYLVEHTIGSRL